MGAAVKIPTPEGKATDATNEHKLPTAKTLPPAPPVENKWDAKATCDPRCQAAEQREKDDLKAQRVMALSAQDQANFTFWQLIVGAGGVLLLIYTLLLTRSANKAAIRAAKAAEDAVKITSDTAEQQLRAYILVESIVRGPVKNAPECDQISINIENFGQTPAHNMVVSSTVEFAESEERANFAEENMIASPSNVLGPKANQSITRFIGKSVPEYEKFLAGEGYIFVYGRIEYEDVFCEVRKPSFRMVNKYPKVGSFGICKEGNTST